MSRKERKEVTLIDFNGVAADGGWIFKAITWDQLINIKREDGVMDFKVLKYKEKAMEIAIDCTNNIPRIAEVLSGMFSKESNFFGLEYVILNYCNNRLKICKSTGRKNIICMLRKAMALQLGNEESREVHVDTSICEKNFLLSDSQNEIKEARENCYKMDTKLGVSHGIWLRNLEASKTLLIVSIEKECIEIEAIPGSFISEFVENIGRIFSPYCNLYGVKAVEIEFNGFMMKADEQNCYKVLDYYEKSCCIDVGLREKESEEYFTSPEYIKDQAKALKNEYRKEVVINKIRQQFEDKDFSIVDEDKKTKWKKYKVINGKGSFGEGVIEYAILWAQAMEFLIAKHNMSIADALESGSNIAGIYGVTTSMFGCAAGILASVWKYGKEFGEAFCTKYKYFNIVAD